jgi:hypothetical protein
MLASDLAMRKRASALPRAPRVGREVNADRSELVAFFYIGETSLELLLLPLT